MSLKAFQNWQENIPKMKGFIPVLDLYSILVVVSLNTPINLLTFGILYNLGNDGRHHT